MPRAGDIHEFFKRFTGSEDMTDRRTFVRSRLNLQFGESRPTLVTLRDVRERCCMIDLGSSIFTLAFDAILDIIPPTVTDPATIKARPGALACHQSGRAVPPLRIQAQPQARPQAREIERDRVRVVERRRERPAPAAAWPAVTPAEGMPEEAPLPLPAGDPMSFAARRRLFTTDEIVAELAQPLAIGD